MIYIIAGTWTLVVGLLGYAFGNHRGFEEGIKMGYTQGWRDHADITPKLRRGPDGKFIKGEDT